jgi:hypothetical protein
MEDYTVYWPGKNNSQLLFFSNLQKLFFAYAENLLKGEKTLKLSASGPNLSNYQQICRSTGVRRQYADFVESSAIR